MLESRKSTTPVAVRTAAIVGFTPLERAGLVLLLAENQVSVVSTLDDIVEFDASAQAEIVLVDLAATTRRAADREALQPRIRMLRTMHPNVMLFGLYRESSGLVLAPEVVTMFDALVDADGRPESLLALIVGTGSPRRAWHKPAISAAPLTLREQQILHLIATGNTSKNVADTLGISMHTVDSHKQRIFRRLGVQNQAQAVAVALRLGLLDDHEQRQGAAS